RTRSYPGDLDAGDVIMRPGAHASGWGSHLSFRVFRPLLAGEHGCGLTLQVDVGIAADVDRDPLDGAAGEGVRVSAGVVAGDRLAAVAAHAQALACDREHPGLGLDP